MSAAVATPVEPRMVDLSKIMGPETVAIEIIYPKMAQTWLTEYNTGNFRNMMPHTVQKYVKAIKAGNFPLSNSAIILCTDPNTGKVTLGDGQHRLQACVDADMPIRQIVLRGADPAIIIHADRGKGRQLSDYLAHMGYNHPKPLSMALKIFHTYKTNVDRISRPEGTDDELYALVKNRPDLVLAVEWAAEHSLGRGKPIRMTTSWLAVARALIFEVSGLPGCKDPDQARKDADFFFSRLIDGDRSMIPGMYHPIAQLLDTLVDHGNRARDVDRFENWKLLALVLKAWNRYREGDHGRQQLRINLGGSNPSAFPEPI